MPSSDPLGKLTARYDARPKALINFVGGGVLALLGVVGIVLWHAVAEACSDPPEPVLFGVLAGGIGLAGAALAAVGLLHAGRSFEVRAHGLRYTDRRGSVDLLWKDIRSLNMTQTNIITDGRHTGTQYEMHIPGRKGVEIDLSPTFLELVPNVRTITKTIELRSGIQFQNAGDAPGPSADAREASLSADELVRRSKGGRRGT